MKAQYDDKNDADYDEENPPLTEAELKQFRPLREVMSAEFVEMVLTHQAKQAALGNAPLPQRGQKSNETVDVPLSPEVLDAFRATGKGW